MRFGAWNVMSLSAGSLIRAVRETGNDLVSTEFSGGTETSGDYIFCSGNEHENHEFGMEFFIQKRTMSSEFISDRLSYIILRGGWCSVIVLNVHDPVEDKLMIQRQLLCGSRMCIQPFP
jgi:hypothetical protein